MNAPYLFTVATTDIKDGKQSLCLGVYQAWSEDEAKGMALTFLQEDGPKVMITGMIVQEITRESLRQILEIPEP